MSHFTGINQEVHAYMTQEVPDSLKSCNSAQAIKARNRIFQISSTSSSQNSGGVVLFNLPPSNYSVSKGTMALRMRVQVTGTNLVAGAAATSASFQGPGGVTAAFGRTYGNAYSVFQRMTLYGSNSSIIEQINYAGDQMNLMLLHNSAQSYLQTDGQVLLGMGLPFLPTAITSAFIDVVVPLPFAAFQSATQDFPMYLMSAPLTIQLDLASVARAIFVGADAATTVTEFSVNNAFLIYQAVELPGAYVEAERQAVRTHPYIMPLTSSLNVQVPQSILTSYTLGLNASSVRAVFVLPSNGASYAPKTQLQYIRSGSDTASTSGSGVNAIVFVDGNQINSAIFDNPIMQFQGLKNALHHTLQGSILQPSAVLGGSNDSTVSNYIQNVFSLGFDLTSFDHESSLFAGTPCTNINLQLTGLAANPTFLSTIIVIYDVLLAIEADGTCQVKR
jgi:hypothetical protein